MATPITPLNPPPLQQEFLSSALVSQAWGTWFDLVQKYIKGFVSTSSGDTDMITGVTYVADSILLVTYTLPSRFNVGDVIRVVGRGAGGWQINTQMGQTIYAGGSSATTSVASTNAHDALTLVGIAKDSELGAVAVVGTLTFT